MESPAFIASRTRPRTAQAYSKATQLQELLENAAHNPELTGVGLSSVTRAWLELERLKRDMRMKPKPKAVDVTKSPRGQRSRSAESPVEPSEPTKAATPEVQ